MRVIFIIYDRGGLYNCYPHNQPILYLYIPFLKFKKRNNNNNSC